MRRLVITAVFFSIGCSGAGVSTTARDEMATGDAATDGSGEGGSDDGDDNDGSGGSGGSGGSSDGSGNDSDNDSGQSDGAASDSGDGGTDGGSSHDPVGLDGTWVSEGANLAPVFTSPDAAAVLTWVESVFDNGVYTVNLDTADGESYTLTGTYAAEQSGVGNVQSITLEQTSPVSAVFEGILEIDNDVWPPVMQYEVSQTGGLGWEPGLVPPTAEGGFGSSQPAGTDNIQIYVWTE